jgi:hypothetical protein
MDQTKTCLYAVSVFFSLSGVLTKMNSSDWCSASFEIVSRYGLTDFQGKTEVAVMTILRVINEHRRDPDRIPKPLYIRESIEKSAFKVIYV